MTLVFPCMLVSVFWEAKARDGTTTADAAPPVDDAAAACGPVLASETARAGGDASDAGF